MFFVPVDQDSGEWGNHRSDVAISMGCPVWMCYWNLKGVIIETIRRNLTRPPCAPVYCVLIYLISCPTIRFSHEKRLGPFDDACTFCCKVPPHREKSACVEVRTIFVGQFSGSVNSDTLQRMQGGGYNYYSPSIRLHFDSHSTAIRRRRYDCIYL